MITNIQVAVSLLAGLCNKTSKFNVDLKWTILLGCELSSVPPHTVFTYDTVYRYDAVNCTTGVHRVLIRLQ